MDDEIADLPQTALAGREWIAAQDVTLWLTEEEHRQYQVFPSARRQADWLAGRLAAKRVLRDTWNIAPQECTIGSDGIAPVIHLAGLENVNFSLSHSMGHGAVSWAWTGSEGTVGIDIQRIRRVHPGLMARLLMEEEKSQVQTLEESLLLFWALKEAAIKARRSAWGRPMKEIVVTLQTPGQAVISLPGETEPFAANYQRIGDWWLARAVRPSSSLRFAPEQSKPKQNERAAINESQVCAGQARRNGIKRTD